MNILLFSAYLMSFTFQQDGAITTKTTDKKAAIRRQQATDAREEGVTAVRKGKANRETIKDSDKPQDTGGSSPFATKKPQAATGK